MKLKFFIRTTGERKLDPSIEKELGNDYTLLIDKEHKPVDSFIKQLSTISEFDSVLLEDDVILCKEFVKEIEKAISEWPNQIINFFTMPHMFFTTSLGFHTFVYNQCTFYPKGIGKKLAEEMVKLREPYNQYDTLLNKALRSLVIPHVIYRPCLVQHIDANTFIQQSTSNTRRCIWYKDYLDELVIDIKDSWSQEAQSKLKELLNEHFKKLGY